MVRTPAVQRPDWGPVVACIASGPSLTAEDVDAVRRAGIPTIVTNSTYRLAPWATALFAFDRRWWESNIAHVRASGFSGRLLAYSPMARNVGGGIDSLCGMPWFRGFGNSGVSAIMLAADGGARRIILLGYDCQFAAGGRKHWHDDHQGMSNCASISRWPAQFKRAARALSAKAEIVNCSRATALDCFRRAPLDVMLAQWAAP